jgi:hypothetical protein
MFSISINAEMKKKGINSHAFHFGEAAEMKKRAQTTAYIIVALVIVVFGIILYFLYPRISQIIAGDTEPGDYMRVCLEPELDRVLELISKQGGYINPEGYIEYQSVPIKYLCYTSKYYVPCYVQQPLLVAHVERELSSDLKEKAESCAGELREYYQSRGYEVTGGNNAEVDVSIAPGRIDIKIDSPMTFTKDTTQEFQTFRIAKSSEMYMLLMTATSIIDFESTYGDSEVTIYMQYYPELQLSKMKLIDGSKIYTIKNVKTSETFTFATRSLAWPGGLGLKA